MCVADLQSNVRKSCQYSDLNVWGCPSDEIGKIRHADGHIPEDIRSSDKSDEQLTNQCHIFFFVGILTD